MIQKTARKDENHTTDIQLFHCLLLPLARSDDTKVLLYAHMPVCTYTHTSDESLMVRVHEFRKKLFFYVAVIWILHLAKETLWI